MRDRRDEARKQPAADIDPGDHREAGAVFVAHFMGLDTILRKLALVKRSHPPATPERSNREPMRGTRRPVLSHQGDICNI